MLGEWLPDFPDYKNPGCLVAENVIPVPGGYGPQYGLLAQSQTATGAILGAKLMFASNGSPIVVGGTTTRLFKNLAGTVSQTTIVTATTEPWDFCRFNDFVVATNVANNPYCMDDLDTDTAWTGLAATAPKARYCERIEDFLMLGGIDGSPSRIQWSPFNSPGGVWTPARLTQAGYANLDKALGGVQRIVGGRYPMIFQERGVQRIEYVGPPTVWRVTEIEGARGCIAPFSVVRLGYITYYIAQDGFWSTDGNSFEQIGGSRVNKWFFDNVTLSDISKTHGTVDFENSCIVWSFVSGGGFTRFIRYSYTENRWSHGRVTVSRLVETVAGDVTLEQLSALYPSIEDVPVSLDDPRWKGRNRTLAAFVDGTTTTDLNLFTGERLAAEIETGEFQLIPGRRVTTKRARPLGEGGQHWQVAPVAIGNDRVETGGAFSSVMEGGWAAIRSDGMTMRLKMRAPAGANWTTIQGVQPDVRPSGGR